MDLEATLVDIRAVTVLPGKSGNLTGRFRHRLRNQSAADGGRHISNLGHKLLKTVKGEWAPSFKA